MTFDPEKHKLMDGVERNAECPDTFHIPNQITRENVALRSFAKIGLTDPDGVNGERFWVRVVQVTDTGYVGEVDNDLTRFPDLMLGEEVPFEAKHVLGVLA